VNFSVFDIFQESISPTFYEQLLNVQIFKARVKAAHKNVSEFNPCFRSFPDCSLSKTYLVVRIKPTKAKNGSTKNRVFIIRPKVLRRKSKRGSLRLEITRQNIHILPLPAFWLDFTKR